MRGFDYNIYISYINFNSPDTFTILGTLNNITNPDSNTFNIGDTIDFEFPGEFVGTFELNGDIFIVIQSGSYHDVFGFVADPDNFVAPDILPPLDESPFIVCFLAGTRIAIPAGERLVEDLAIGDFVLTADGRAVPVTWIGRQRVVNHRFGLHESRAPVRIAAGALGQGLPHSDLCVSADHGMVWEGLVVNAGAMVNGTTIHFVPRDELPAEYTYFHIETAGHEVVLANGAPAETFVDYVTRSHFDNYQEYLDLYGAERVVVEMPRPRVSAQRMLPDALRAKLGLAPYGTGLTQERDALLQRLEAARAA